MRPPLYYVIVYSLHFKCGPTFVRTFIEQRIKDVSKHVIS